MAAEASEGSQHETWRALMALGLGRLGLSPREFWAMTPAELVAAAEGLVGRPALASVIERHDLHALMNRYPDGAMPLSPTGE